MNYEVLQLVQVGLILGFAAFAQSAVGFGFALFATPMLLFLGIPLPDTITLVATSSTIQSLLAVKSLHKSVPWSLAFSSTAVRIVTIIVGIFLLKSLVMFSTVHIKAIIGGILCVIAFTQLIWRSHPVDKMHWGWAGLSWSTSGLLSGVCGMGGPPLVLWAIAHTWSSNKIRGFMFAVIVTSTPFQIALLCLTFGSQIFWNIILAILFLPMIYIGLRLGLPIGNNFSKQSLRKIALIILLLIGGVAIMQTFKDFVL